MTARDAWGQVAHNFRVLADSIDAAIEPDAARASVPAAGGVPPHAPAPADQPNTALGMCPDHRVAWTVKAGGISKNGKPYKAFWKCGEKTDGNYCQQKPTRAWSDSHPIELVADDEPPF